MGKLSLGEVPGLAAAADQSVRASPLQFRKTVGCFLGPEAARAAAPSFDSVLSPLEVGVMILRRRLWKVKAPTCGGLGLRARSSCQASPRSSLQTTLPPTATRFDPDHCLAKGYSLLVQMGRPRPGVKGHIVAFLFRLVPSLESPLFCRDPGGWAHRGCREPGLAGGPECSLHLKGNRVPESGQLRGHGGSSAPCRSHSFLPLAQLTRTPSGVPPGSLSLVSASLSEPRTSWGGGPWSLVCAQAML